MGIMDSKSDIMITVCSGHAINNYSASVVDKHWGYLTAYLS